MTTPPDALDLEELERIANAGRALDWRRGWVEDADPMAHSDCSPATCNFCRLRDELRTAGLLKETEHE